ncbi:hypothetical protein KKE06_00885 [Candidatus Micrarchaeota archaeon]|nr:hypothetical protein [Candidatus Micrarchaeota archaeon]MBU1930445.1 hypothetical protein [Candidatus Micrarchaeota archaeon]
MTKTPKMQNETKRQIVHYLIGNAVILLFVGFLWAGFERAALISLLILILAIGYVIALYIKKKGSFTLLQEIVKHVERPHEKHFPGKPVFLFLIGAVIALAIFPQALAVLAAFIVLTYGDTIATLVGKYKGRITLVTNRTLEGTIAGIIISSIALAFIFPFSLAIPIATIGMLAEYIPINDNIGIPIVAGFAATLLI